MRAELHSAASAQPPKRARPTNAAAGSGRRDFDDFYRACYGRLTAQLHAYLGDRAEAEDVVQEAFVRTWQRWSDISRYEDPVAWVRRVAWNLATSRLRHLTVASRVLRRLHPVPDAPNLSPDHVVLVQALRRLPNRQRQAIVLHYIADLPVVDIAADLRVSKGTVVSWLYRGRARLAGLLTDATEDTTFVQHDVATAATPDAGSRKR